MATYHIEDSYNSRWLDSDASTPVAAEGANVTGHDGSDLVLVIQYGRYAAGACNKATNSETIILRVDKNGGGYAAVGSTGDVRYTSNTSLTDGNANPDYITAGTLTDGSGGSCTNGWEGGVQDENNNIGSQIVSANYFKDVSYGLDFSNATAGATYSFELYNSTTATPLTKVGTVGSVIIASIGNLSIDVSDTVGTAESLTDKGSSGITSILDLVRIIEGIVSKMQDLTPPALDELTGVIENVDSKVSGGNLTSSEIIAIAESIQSVMTGGKLSVYDIAGIIEDITVQTGITALPEIDVFDLMTIIEDIIMLMENGRLSIDEAINIVENTSARMSNLVMSISEIVAITESVQAITSGGSFTVFNISAVQENISSIMSNLYGDRFDSMTIEEYVNMIVVDVGAITFSKYDIIAIAERVTIIASSLKRFVSDQSAVEEYINLFISDLPSIAPNIFDVLGVIENINSVISSLFNLHFEKTAVSEAVLSKMTDPSNTSIDSVSVSEFLGSNMSGLYGSISNKITVQEYLNLISSGLYQLSSENSAIQEYLNIVVAEITKVFAVSYDIASIGEYIVVSMIIPAQSVMSFYNDRRVVSFTYSSRLVSFSDEEV